MGDKSDPIERVENPGELLRRAREALNLSIADVAASTRQSQDTLAALESMQTANMPATILRMQARIYAQFLNLDADALASAYAAEPGQMQMPRSLRSSQGKRGWMAIRAPLIGLAAAFTVVLSISAIWMLSTPSPETSHDPLAVSSRVQLGGNPTALQITDLATNAALELSLTAQRRAWIEVRGSDGTIFRSRVMSAGETYFPRRDAGWTLTTRDAGAFSIFLDDDFVAPLGDDGQAIYSRNVDDLSRSAVDTLQRALAERDGATPNNR